MRQSEIVAGEVYAGKTGAKRLLMWLCQPWLGSGWINAVYMNERCETKTMGLRSFARWAIVRVPDNITAEQPTG